MLGNGHRAVLFFALAASLYAGSVAADVKVAFIDPLSGGAAATGILAQKTHQFYIDAINAAGGINGEKIELMSVVFDLADRISVLVYGKVITSDTPERVRANEAVQAAYLGTSQHVGVERQPLVAHEDLARARRRSRRFDDAEIVLGHVALRPACEHHLSVDRHRWTLPIATS